MKKKLIFFLKKREIETKYFFELQKQDFVFFRLEIEIHPESEKHVSVNLAPSLLLERQPQGKNS